MYRIFFVATLGFTLTLSPVLNFDGAADAKGGEGASSGGSSSGNGKGKSGQSGSSNSGSSNKGAGAKALPGQAVAASRPPRVLPTRGHPMPEGTGRHQTAARANPARAALPTAALRTMVQVPKALPGQAVAASRHPRVRRTMHRPMPEGAGRHQGRQGQIRPERPFQRQQWCRCQGRCWSKPWGPVGRSGFRLEHSLLQCRSERVDVREREGQIRPERLFEQWCRCKRHRRSKRWGTERFFSECHQR